MKVLVTGGCGFIGSHLVDALVEEGCDVVVMDNLCDQVHPNGMPPWANPKVNYRGVSVTRHHSWVWWLRDVDVVFHQAALVGMAQSMYEPEPYVRTNVLGTAQMLQAMCECPHLRPKKVIVAASMSAYGEGLYACPKHGVIEVGNRKATDLVAGMFEHLCPLCGEILSPAPTHEAKQRQSYTVYAQTKAMQEDMVLSVCRSLSIPAVALRYFNVFGPRQSLTNPYTGVVAIFLARLLSGKAPMIYEDGRQARDFVSVHDVVQANLLAMKSGATGAYNVGSGTPISILDVHRHLAQEIGDCPEPEVTGRARMGDIRHCFADIEKAKGWLGYRPKVAFEDGIKELVEACRGMAVEDRFDQAQAELEARKLA